MKKKLKKLRLSNEGFSLIELLVTMLVSSIVTAAVVGFLTVGLNYYRRANAETSLQTESQVTEIFLTELFQEAQNFTVLDATAYPSGVGYAVEVIREGVPYIVAKKGEVLVFGVTDATKTDVTERIEVVTDQSLENVFLARYVSVFNVSPVNREQSLSLQNGLVKLTMQFTVDGKTYTGTQTVSLRNTIKN